MQRKEDIQSAKAFLSSLKKQRSRVAALKTMQITNQDEKNAVSTLSQIWFEKFSKRLLLYGIDQNVIGEYDAAFKSLLRLSSGNSRRTSYEKQFSIILKNFNENIIIYLQTNPVEIDANQSPDEIKKLLDKIPGKDENEYVLEALGCWEHGYLKAATVLIWCAAIDQIHKTIEKIGFSKFNQTSSMMKAQTKGRYKNFNKEFSIQSKNDLQAVFDNDILSVLEAMQIIDTNEKSRLASCFSMRCHSGHPGAAPITPYNVISCFSDIIEIVLSNPKFSVTEKDANDS